MKMVGRFIMKLEKIHHENGGRATFLSQGSGEDST